MTIVGGGVGDAARAGDAAFTGVRSQVLDSEACIWRSDLLAADGLMVFRATASASATARIRHVAPDLPASFRRARGG